MLNKSVLKFIRFSGGIEDRSERDVKCVWQKSAKHLRDGRAYGYDRVSEEGNLIGNQLFWFFMTTMDWTHLRGFLLNWKNKTKVLSFVVWR